MKTIETWLVCVELNGELKNHQAHFFDARSATRFAKFSSSDPRTESVLVWGKHCGAPKAIYQSGHRVTK